MNSPSVKFNREELERLLSLLNEELMASNVTGEICIVGGAAMVLAFGSRRSTRDIDALLIAPSAVRKAVARVAENEGIPVNWLNDGAKGFASGASFESKELLKLSHLRVITPPAEYILAMKCIAARVGLDENDKEDAKSLVSHLGLASSDAVNQVVASYYDAARIPAKTRYFIEEVCDELFRQS